MNLLVDSIGKQYRGNVWGLQDISLQLRPGVLGLLGPNGAAKSTLMRILATVTRPTRGRVLWNDADVLSSPDPLRTVLGYLPQDFGIYPHLTVFEFWNTSPPSKVLNLARRVAASTNFSPWSI
jgi:ABC-2 type transport system ATP-binding protein